MSGGYRRVEVFLDVVVVFFDVFGFFGMAERCWVVLVFFYRIVCIWSLGG